MAIDLGTYFGNLVITVLTLLVFLVVVLAFLYVIWGKEEPAQTQVKPKAKSI